MEQLNTISASESSIKLGITYRELGVFLLLLFLNLKFATIVILNNRSFIIDMTVYLLFIITFNYSNWTYKSLMYTAIIIGICTLINFSPYKLNVLMPLLIIQSVSGMRFKRYLAMNFIISGFFLLVMYLINGVGHNMAGFTYLTDRKIRMSFGFNHPNVAALHYFCFMINALLLLCFSKFRKYIPIYLILIFPLWFFIYKKTGSRSFLLSILVLYGSYFYYFLGAMVNRKHLLRISGYIYISLIFIFSAITVFFALQREYFDRLDLLLSKRLSLYGWFLDRINIIDFFFGSDTFKDYVIDSSYLHLLFEAGILFFIGICVFYVLSTVNMVNKKAWIPVCVIFSFMAYGLMESMLLYGILIGTNLFWMLLYFYFRDGKMPL